MSKQKTSKNRQGSADGFANNIYFDPHLLTMVPASTPKSSTGLNSRWTSGKDKSKNYIFPLIFLRLVIQHVTETNPFMISAIFDNSYFTIFTYNIGR